MRDPAIRDTIAGRKMLPHHLIADYRPPRLPCLLEKVKISNISGKKVHGWLTPALLMALRGSRGDTWLPEAGGRQPNCNPEQQALRSRTSAFPPGRYYPTRHRKSAQVSAD